MKEEAQQELVSIYERDGALNPEAVVDAARSKKSALHDRFNWDDKAAAHEHRLHVARKIISVAVTVIPALSNSPVKQFVSIKALRGTDKGSYIATADILSDEAKYAMALNDALRDLERLKYRYNHFKDLAPVWAALDKVLAQVERAAAV